MHGFVAGGFASSGYGALSPGHYSLSACFFTEFVMTFSFSCPSPAPFEGCGGRIYGHSYRFALTLIHQVSMPVTNMSVSPARGSSREFEGLDLSTLYRRSATKRRQFRKINKNNRLCNEYIQAVR
jgi:hypothetical protein